MSVASLNQEQQEILALLQSELETLVELAEAGFPGQQQAITFNDEQQQLLTDFVEDLSPIAGAVELAGLQGLSATCHHLMDNFTALAQHRDPVEPALQHLLNRWASYLLAYIEAIHTPEATQAAVDQLLVLLKDQQWPVLLSKEQLQDLQERFQSSHFDLQEDDLPEIPQQATDDMVAITPSAEVRAELLDGMLIELPRQTRELEESIGRFLQSHDLADLNQAQRMAHTIKGAGNIVGIAGVANLMHYLEDILESVSADVGEAEDFHELLLTTADTLAEITEYLTGQGPAPTPVARRQVLQQLLDYARQLKTASPAEDFSIDDIFTEDVPEEIFKESPAENSPTEAISVGDSLIEDSHTEDSFIDNSFTENSCFEETDAVSPPAEDTTAELDSISAPELVDLNIADADFFASAEFDDDLLGELSAEDLESLTGELNDESLLDDEPASLDEPALAAELPKQNQAEPVAETPARDDSSTARQVPSQPQSQPQAQPQVQLEVNQPASSPAQTPQPARAAAAAEEETSRLSLTLGMAQELLRIAGESQITHARLESQIQSMHQSLQVTEDYQLRLRTMAMELESLVQTQNAVRAATMKYAEHEIDPIELERYSEMDTFSNQLLELTTDSFEAVAHIEEELRQLSSVSYLQKQLNKDNQGLLLKLRMVPVNTMESRFARCVRQASRLSQKSANFVLEGGELLVDSMVLHRIVDPLMHLLRNAVDHGLEADVDQRQRHQKSPEGTITLSFEQRGETLSIHCRDDGRGLDLAKIRGKALAKGLIGETDANDEKLLEQVILLPGFSTRSGATQTSGRGIGLDAVATEVKAMKGNLSLQSEPGQGCCFTLTLPTSILTGHGLLIRSSNEFAQQSVSLVSRNIEQLIYVSDDDLEQTEDGWFFDYDEVRIPVLHLNKLLNLFDQPSEQVGAILLTHRPGGELIAVAVEAVLASQDMVIKPLNPLVLHPPGVVGATILGDGQVSPVADLQELPGIALANPETQWWQHQQAAGTARPNAPIAAPLALVVDDSLSARRSLAHFVTDMGWEVATAKDGFEAIELIDAKKPTLILADLEMPRMNGLELTAHLRSREDTRQIPVIMITSRMTEKHRAMASSSGVNSYLHKPWSEEDLLNAIQQELPTESVA